MPTSAAALSKSGSLYPEGASGRSTRTLLATNQADRWIYVYGFVKNEKDNITTKELEALRLLAADLLRLSDEQVHVATRQGVLVEVHDKKNKP